MPSRESIAAGAALGSAKDLGLSESQQASASILAAQKVADDKAKEPSDHPQSRIPADSLDIDRSEFTKAQLEPLPEQEPIHHHHRPVRARREGFLLKLAHWLNLK